MLEGPPKGAMKRRQTPQPQNVLRDCRHVTAPVGLSVLAQEMGTPMSSSPGRGDGQETVYVPSAGRVPPSAHDRNCVSPAVRAQVPPQAQVSPQGFKEEAVSPPDQERSFPPSWNRANRLDRVPCHCPLRSTGPEVAPFSFSLLLKCEWLSDLVTVTESGLDSDSLESGRGWAGKMLSRPRPGREDTWGHPEERRVPIISDSLCRQQAWVPTGPWKEALLGPAVGSHASCLGHGHFAGTSAHCRSNSK